MAESLLLGLPKMAWPKDGITKAGPQHVWALQRRGLATADIANVLGLSERTGLRYVQIAALRPTRSV